MTLRSLALSICLLLPLAAVASDAVVTRSSSLHAEPFSDARAVTSLSRGAAVQLMERRGGWYRARSGGAEGWIRMASIRLQERSQAGGESGLSESLRFVGTGRSGSRGSQATTGIRGLDKRELSQASPNRAALAQLDKYAVDERAARRFGRQHGLGEAP